METREKAIAGTTETKESIGLVTKNTRKLMTIFSDHST
jgi:hypothetical protein